MGNLLSENKLLGKKTKKKQTMELGMKIELLSASISDDRFRIKVSSFVGI